MTAGLAWLSAFPLAEAAKAVHALQTAWEFLAAEPKKDFHPKQHEPKLTRVLRAYVDRVVSREHGLLGYWGTEGVENEVDFKTGSILDERRTDILYAWNDDQKAMRLVFEFKKLGQGSSSRSHYLGEKGLLRFVTGPYSRQQSVAVMVGILTAAEEVVAPALHRALQNPATARATLLCPNSEGQLLHRPSILFPNHANFDTEHLRHTELGPGHGTIRVSHLFFSFGYPLPLPSSKRNHVLEALESVA